jgi:hypothetical protein
VGFRGERSGSNDVVAIGGTFGVYGQVVESVADLPSLPDTPAILGKLVPCVSVQLHIDAFFDSSELGAQPSCAGEHGPS